MKETKSFKNIREGENLRDYLLTEITKRLTPEELDSSSFLVSGATSPNTARRENHISLNSICRGHLTDIISEIPYKNELKFIIDPIRRGSNNYILGQLIKPLSIAVNEINFSFNSSMFDRNKIQVEFDYCSISFNYNTLTYDEEKEIYSIKSSKNGNIISVEHITLMYDNIPNYIYLSDLDNFIEQKKKELIEKEREIEKIKTSISKRQYIKEYMVDNKIESHDITTLKSRMIMDSFSNSEEEDKESLLTDINEIVSIKLKD